MHRWFEVAVMKNEKAIDKNRLVPVWRILLLKFRFFHICSEDIDYVHMINVFFSPLVKLGS